MAVVALSVLLPSGTVGWVNVKVVAFTAALLSLTTYLLVCRRALSRDSLHLLLMFLASISFFASWALLGLLRGTAELQNAIPALAGFLVTVSIAYLARFLHRERLISFASFLRLVLISAAAFAAAKVAIVAALYLRLIEFPAVRSFFLDVMDYSVVSMTIVPGLVRLQLINDVLTPLALFYLLLAPRFGCHFAPWMRRLMFLVMTVSIFLAFSRFIFLLTLALAILWTFFFAVRRLRLVIAAYALLIAAGVASALYAEDVARLVEHRFLSPEVTASDRVRRDQLTALQAEASRYPFFGKGVGGYAEAYVSSRRTPYSYELQWLAFLVQFGIVGLIGLIAHVVAVALGLARRITTGMGAFLLGAYALWLLSGFTNPYLMSSTSAVIFSLFLLSSAELGTATRSDAHGGHAAETAPAGHRPT